MLTAILVIGIVLLVFFFVGRFGGCALLWLLNVALVIAVILIIVWLLRAVFALF
jgi:hypothetical protein